MENVKKQTEKSWIFLGLAAGVLVMSAGIWGLFFMNKSYSPNAKAYVDGRIETGDSEIDKAYEKFFLSEPAELIQDQKENPEKTIRILFRGLNEDVNVNEVVLKRLEETGIKASFALSAAETLENKDYVARMLKAGQELVSNGTDGSGNLQSREVREMIEDMLTSREAISTGADVAVPLLYCDSEVTAELLNAAAVSGYEALVDPNEDRVITDDTFSSREEIEKEIDSLQGQTILVFDLRGKWQPAQEEAVYAQAPVIDKQEDLKETPEETEKETISAQEEFQWLTEVLEEKEIPTGPVGEMERTPGIQVLRQQADAPDAERAAVYHYCLTKESKIGVGIIGLPEKSLLRSLLAELGKNAASAPFFVSLKELETRGEEIREIAEAGYSIGLTDGGEKVETAGAAFDSMQSGLHALYQYTEDPARLYYVQSEENLDSVRIAAKLLNVKVVQTEAENSMQAGAFYILDLKNRKAVEELKQKAEGAGLALSDIQTLIQNSGTISVLAPEKVNEMRRNNQQKQVEAQNMVYTTERAFSFSFYDLGHENAVLDTLDAMKARNGNATFFVTLNELMSKPSLIEAILADGHDVDIAYKATKKYPQTFDAVTQYLNAWETYAKWRYGIDSEIVFMPNGKAENETKEALHTAGCSLIESTFHIVKTEDKEIVLDNIPEVIGKLERIRLTRGAFVSFNMGYYENDRYTQRGSTIFGVMLDGFMNAHVDTLAYRSHDTGEIEDASRFEIHTVSRMLDSPEKYTLSNQKQTDITLDKNVLTNMATDQDRFNWIRDHYIGTRFIDTGKKLPGFSASEVKSLDKSGVFTNDKVIFLSFDDWGTEQSLNELLYVLEKQNVKATFFIKTEYVDANPNLLRTIAVKGHQIACHTDGHVPLANPLDENESVDLTLTDEEALNLRKDIVTSYNKLYKYTGNVEVDGKPALSKMFRPPTLAVSKNGISQVFDVGFDYSVSGEISTGDYEASSYEDMLERLQRRRISQNEYMRVHDGTVLVMHMQENAKYTAQVLDAMIPIWKEQGYTFARIDDYLGR